MPVSYKKVKVAVFVRSQMTNNITFFNETGLVRLTENFRNRELK